jgi:HPt (histidine-containing phosphotransfer) domain-containing protein
MRDICGDGCNAASLSSSPSMLAMSSAPQPQPPALPRVLDELSLRRLHELDPQGTNRVVERVLRAFEASLQRLLPQAAQALGSGDHEAVRHVVHTLKSSSASVGALELSRCCSEIENRLRMHQADGLAQLLARLDAEGERVLAAVRDLLPR